ncbi:TPA: LPXTG cell wall anchor domain-containing protein [Streptococcus suis]|nr:LPXTG cell wall anchor domain-containing protein [Streptococcus suis]
MQVKKFAKWGLALTSTLVLGGVVGPVGGNLVNNSTVVHAEEIQSRVAVHAGYYFNGELVFAAFDLEEFWVSPGESRSIVVPAVDGYVYEGKYLLSNRNGERLLQGSPSARYEDTVGSRFVDVILIYAPVDKPVDTPTEQPAEQPTDQPVEQPVDQPVDQPVEQPTETPAEQPVEKPITYRIHYFLNDVVENGGTPSYTDIAPYKEGVISKGETIVEVAPHIDGYAVAGNNTIPVTYDHVTGDNVWHDEDWYPTSYFFYDKIEVPKPTEKPVEQPVETPAGQPTEQPPTTPTDQPAEVPVEQPVETPANQPVDQPAETSTAQPTETPAEKPVATPTEKPAEQPVSTPTDQPTEKPTATSLLAGNTASKAQPVVTTDKNSTPSTTAVKSEEGSQATAKTLPKTGDSSSMLLVLGGLLSGLSGLGLAAPSRKRD